MRFLFLSSALVPLTAAVVLGACGAGDTTPVGPTGGAAPTSTGGTVAPSADGGKTSTADGGAPPSSSIGPSPGNCYPAPGNTGNEKNVGAYCSKGGGQCGPYGNLALQCSSDLSAQGGNFCLIVGCSSDGDCGLDGCCSAPAGSLVRACIPIGCFEAGVCSPIAPPGSD